MGEVSQRTSKTLLKPNIITYLYDHSIVFMTNDQQKLKVEIEKLEKEISQKQQKLNEILTVRTPKIGSENETENRLKRASESSSDFEEKVQDMFLAFEENRLKRDHFRTYMYFFSFPVVLIFLVACSYAIYKNPGDKNILGIGAAALTTLLTLLGYSSYKKNKE